MRIIEMLNEVTRLGSIEAAISAHDQHALRPLLTAAAKIGVTLAEYIKQYMMGNKWCSGCIQWIPTKEFYRNKSSHDFLSSTCKRCNKERNGLGEYSRPAQIFRRRRVVR